MSSFVPAHELSLFAELKATINHIRGIQQRNDEDKK
jgi:hypothetical protein